jgi:quinol monooxygenase YgiN
MYIVRGSFRWPAGTVPLVELAELAGQVRARHAGNIDYRFSVDSGDPTLIYLNEAWEHADDFARHGQTPEVAEIGAVVGRGATDVRVTGYEVASIRSVIPPEEAK